VEQVAVALQDVSSRDKHQNGCGWSDEGVAYTVDAAATQGVAVAEPAAFSAGQSEHAGSLGYAVGVSPTLRGAASGTNQVPSIVMAQGCANAEITEGFSPTLTTVHDGPPIVMAPAFSKRPGQQIATRDDGSSFALTTGEPPRLARAGYAVRRLTPLECERLQGFPDGWTDVPWRGKKHAGDGVRYHAIGNSMAVNVMRWIGERIAAVQRETPPTCEGVPTSVPALLRERVAQ